MRLFNMYVMTVLTINILLYSRDTQYSWNVKKFIERTPCARESMLYGMAGGILVGAGYFLKSSKWNKHLRTNNTLEKI